MFRASKIKAVLVDGKVDCTGTKTNVQRVIEKSLMFREFRSFWTGMLKSLKFIIRRKRLVFIYLDYKNKRPISQ